jgi:leucyl-tRNA synthetase
VKKKLRQWYLRITEYADRLLEGLDRVEFSDAMKEMQTNWIGKSSGAKSASSFELRAASKAQSSQLAARGLLFIQRDRTPSSASTLWLSHRA